MNLDSILCELRHLEAQAARVPALEAELLKQAGLAADRVRDALAEVRDPTSTLLIGAPGSAMREAQELGKAHRAEVAELRRQLLETQQDRHSILMNRDEKERTILTIRDALSLAGHRAEDPGDLSALPGLVERLREERDAARLARNDVVADLAKLRAELDALKAPRLLSDEEATAAFEAPASHLASIYAVARAAERKLVGALLGAADDESAAVVRTLLSAIAAIGAPAAEPAKVEPAKADAAGLSDAELHALFESASKSLIPRTAGLRAVANATIARYRARLKSSEALVEAMAAAAKSDAENHSIGRTAQAALTAAIAYADGAENPAAGGMATPRCMVCNWPLHERPEDGCTAASCSYRPERNSDEWVRIERRKVAMGTLADGAETRGPDAAGCAEAHVDPRGIHDDPPHDWGLIGRGGVGGPHGAIRNGVDWLCARIDGHERRIEALEKKS